jgi:hypothetical protein
MSSDSPPAAHGDSPANPRGDFRDALAWMALGIAIFVGSVTMDRLADQDVNPYTVPGLLPGLLGIAMIILGAVLLFRSWRQGGLAPAPKAPSPVKGAYTQLILALGLCLTFGVVLVGHGLPFWLAAALFVTAAIVALQRPQRIAADHKLTLRFVVAAATIGIGAGFAITLVFQEIFLVRLP